MVIFRILEDKRLKPIFYFLLVFLLWSRLWALHEKPYHHDEGIYATLSFRYFQNFGYQFSPVTHGPFLYTFQSLLFRIMPINNFSGRLPVALAGIILPFAALGFFRKATSYRAISWIALCVFSPTLCYFSRFLGMDALLITLSVMVATLGLQWWKTERSIYIYSMAFFFAMMLCTKLNWLFYVFSFATFLIVSGDSKAVAKRLKEHWQDTLGFFMIVVYFFGLLYSTLGKHMSGIWDGLFGKMIPYWINQNKLQRIPGPFHYYLTLISIYELPLLVGFVFWIKMLLKDERSKKILGKALLFAFLVFPIIHLSWAFLQALSKNVFHIDHAWHYPLAIMEVILGYVATTYHLKKDEKLQAFFVYWAMTSLLLYSYAGEKIPWLTVHILLPAYLYMASLLMPLKTRWANALIVMMFFWQGMNVIRTCLVNSAKPQERLVYTHTTYELDDFVSQLNRLRTMQPDLKVVVQGASDGVWPLAWYFRDYPAWYQFEVDAQDPPHFFVDNWEKQAEAKPFLKNDYSVRRLPLRAWWVPDPLKGSLINFVRYYFLHEPYSPMGHTDLALYIRKDILPIWESLLQHEL